MKKISLVFGCALSIFFGFMVSVSAQTPQTQKKSPIFQNGVIQDCGIDMNGIGTVLDCTAEIKKDACSSVPLLEQKVCEANACVNTALTELKKTTEAKTYTVLTTGVINTATNYSVGSKIFNGIDDAINKKKQEIQILYKNKTDPNDIRIKDAWNKINATDFRVESGKYYKTGPNRYEFTMDDKDGKKITESVPLLDDKKQPVSLDQGIQMAEEMEKILGNNAKVLDIFVKNANDNILHIIGSTPAQSSTNSPAPQSPKEIAAREEEAFLRAQQQSWLIAQSVVKSAINAVESLIEEKEGACYKSAQKILSTYTLEVLGEKTKSFNIVNRLSVGKENKLTLLDSDPTTGEKSILDKVIRLMAQITGTLAVLLIISGAVLMIVSRGTDSLLTKGKNMVMYTLGGVVLVFLSYIIVQFVISFLFTIG